MKNILLKLLSVTLTVLIALSLCGNALYAADNFKIYGNDVVASNGKAVVTISMENNPGFLTLNLWFTYDNEYFTLEKEGIINKVDQAEVTHGLTTFWEIKDDYDQYSDDGVLCELIFTVSESAPVGKHEITVYFVEAVDENFDPVYAETFPATITIACDHASTTGWKSDVDAHWRECTKCGEKTEEAAHNWNSGKTTKEATCTEIGEKTYTCTICSKTKTEVITASGHKYGTEWKYDDDSHWHQCKNCDDKTDISEHDLVEVVDKEATEDNSGTKHYECACGYKSESSVIPPLDHTHNLTHVEAVESTCIMQGNIEYWSCSKCGLVYADSEATILITDVKAPLNNHSYVLCAEVPADHFNEGTSGHYNCSVCDKVFDMDLNETTVESLVVPVVPHDFSGDWVSDGDSHWKVCACGVIAEKSDHSFVWTVVSESTEDEEGLENGLCSVCGYSEERSIPKKEHELEFFQEVPATCTSTGSLAYYHCNFCGRNYEDEGCTKELTGIETPIDAANHVGGETVKGVIAATCFSEGYTGDSYCDSCSQIVKVGTAVAIDHNAHSFVGDKCELCGANKTVPVISYIYNDADTHYLMINGMYVATEKHTTDSNDLYTDGVYSWHICRDCGNAYGKVKTGTEPVETVEQEEPVEGGTIVSEYFSVFGDIGSNGKLAVAIVAGILVLAAIILAPIVYKKSRADRSEI